MPELPEVETVLRGLEPVLLNNRLASVQVNRADLRVPIPKNFKKTLEGQRITQAIRRGKYILAFGENGKGFVLHLGMSGRIAIHGAQDSYEPQKHDHVVLSLDDRTRIVFNDPRRFGMMYLTDAHTWQKESPFASMGPEPLGNEFSGKILAARLAGKRTPIKTALLDQHVVAGVGNIYACEALCESGISPLREARDVQGKDAEALARAVRNVLQRAIESGGSSLKDYAKTDGSLGYFQTQMAVYDREGLACRLCDRDNITCRGVKRIVQAGRSTFYCATRQKK